MDDAVRAYLDAIPPEHRPLFDRLKTLAAISDEELADVVRDALAE